ncbi:hypothetical+protein [Methylocapsa aurea]|uniref:trypsin-like serine peptidase n=1 Tax=Methylocapsa aurea TaxID=663610 RepID=UPI003D18DE72
MMRGGERRAGAGVGGFRTAIGALLLLAASGAAAVAALYPREGRRFMAEEDFRRYPGAGVLMCRTEEGVPERAAAAWLIGGRGLVVLNAHNFVDRKLRPTHPIDDCTFGIGEKEYAFETESLRFGFPPNAKALNITDDWALVRLRDLVDADIAPQPIPDGPVLPTGLVSLHVVMVSPAGHSNFRRATSIEECQIRQIDAPSEDGIRRARHDCNDGYGGSGSGIFSDDGRLVAMHSASLDMNSRRDFDMERHFGMALLFEGELLDAIRQTLQADAR